MIEIGKEIKEFVEKHIYQIEHPTKEIWDELYTKLFFELEEPREIGQFTELMLNVDAQLLDKLDYIPSYFLAKTQRNTFDIPENYNYIDSSAFIDSSIESIVIPGNIDTIQDSVFNNCKNLKHIQLNDGLEYIGGWVFSNCPLEELTLPKSVTDLRECCFQGTPLKSITYAGTMDEWYNIVTFQTFDNSNIERIICTDGAIDL